MSAPAASRETVRADDRPALAAGAAPGVADPVQPVAAEEGVVFFQAHRPYGYGVEHVTEYPTPLAERQCLACGVVGACYPGLPCAACGASHFHLIPRPPQR